MSDARPSGLQTIFAIFLGLMVTAFIGVGVYTFFPSPQSRFNDELRDVNREEQALRESKAPGDLTQAERTRLQEIQNRRNRAEDAGRAAGQSWGRTTSIILIAFATFVMAISLVRAGQLPVLSNGLLLGGVFTMLYGVGWIVVTDASVARFVVLTVALAITLAMGYARFVRRQSLAVARGPDLVPAGQGLEELEHRVRGLEQRLDAAASALGKPRT